MGTDVSSPALTDSSSDDAYVGLSILEQIEGTITQFAADGAYDTRPMYEALAASGAADIRIVIPPKKTATVDSRAIVLGIWAVSGMIDLQSMTST